MTQTPVAPRWRRLYAASAAVPGLRRVTARPGAYVRYHSALGAFAVRERAGFALREALGRRETATYHLADGTQVLVRHGVGDAWVVDEVFNRGVYDPPPPVEAVLRGLDHPVRVVDLGAHVGAVTLRYLRRFPGSTVTAFEPNRASVALLRDTLTRNGLDERVMVIEAAAGAEAGSASLAGTSVLSHVVRDGEDRPEHLGEFAEHFGADPHEVQIVDVLPALQAADLLKLDIEGGEWAILADPRFAGSAVRAVVLEFHLLGAPGGDARRGVVDVLEAAGFTVGEPFDERHGEGMVWAWR